jgi:hypothetical protein
MRGSRSCFGLFLKEPRKGGSLLRWLRTTVARYKIRFFIEVNRFSFFASLGEVRFLAGKVISIENEYDSINLHISVDEN